VVLTVSELDAVSSSDEELLSGAAVVVRPLVLRLKDERGLVKPGLEDGADVLLAESS
jgi:hypothetical protein